MYSSLSILVILLTLACVHGSAITRDETPAPSADNWSSQILKGVSTVPFLNENVRLAVWGDKARPVLTQDFKPQNILIAAAEYEQGRVVVFPTEHYTQLFMDDHPAISTLSSNIKNWLTGDSAAAVEDISSKSSFSVDSNTKIAVWDGTDKSTEFVSALKTWLGSGNGLVVSVIRYNVIWQEHKAVNGLLMEMGMVYQVEPWETEVTSIKMKLGMGTYGQGKFVTLPEYKYIQKFIDNDDASSEIVWRTTLWLGGDSAAAVEDISSMSSFSVDSNTKIAVWDGKDKSAEFVSALKTWVGSGNGLAVSVSPSSDGTNKAVTDLMKEMGVKYYDIEWNTYQNISTLNNRADKAHLGQMSKDPLNIYTIIKYQHFLTQGVVPMEVALKEWGIKDMFDQSPVNWIPTVENNVQNDGIALFNFYDKVFIKTGLVDKAPGIESFPGDFETPPQLVSAEIEISSYQEEMFSTGFYLPAGQKAKITILSGSMDGWSLQVNVHHDNLYHKSSFARWPVIYNVWTLSEDEMTFKSLYGGLIVLNSPGGENTIKVRLENVVETPRYDITDPKCDEQWAERKSAPGLWAVLEGEFISIVLPSRVIRNFDSPRDIMQQHDTIVKAMYYLKGDNIRDNSRQWVVTDVQITYGAGHAGYPIMLAWDLDYLPTQTRACESWGLFHEVGHNLQEGAWTLTGQSEVTNNMLVIYIRERFCKFDPWIGGFGKGNRMDNGTIDGCKSILKKLGTGFDMDLYATGNWIPLYIIRELSHHLGWPHFAKVLRAYNTIPNPSGSQAEIDEWVIQSSQAAQRDMRPCYEFWGWPLTDRVKTSVESLTPYFFKDVATDEWAPQRAAFILERYPGVSREIEKSTEQFDETIPPPTIPQPQTKISNQKNM